MYYTLGLNILLFDQKKKTQQNKTQQHSISVVGKDKNLLIKNKLVTPLLPLRYFLNHIFHDQHPALELLLCRQLFPV